MTSRRGLRDQAYYVGFRMFHRLPMKVRRRIVRTVAPTYTLGAVTLLLDARTVGDTPAPAIPDSARILLLRQPPGFGWSLPGGLIDRGEQPLDCAARELWEETGVRLPVTQFVPAVPNAVIHPRGQWVDTVFVAHVDPADHPAIPDGVEVDELAWHPVADLPRLTLPTARLLARYGLGPLTGLDDPDTAVYSLD